MSNNRIDKEDIVSYLKTQVQSAKNQEDGPKLNLENIKFHNSYSLFDKVFPFHIFWKTGEKIPRMDIDFLCTYRYLSHLRYEFVNLLNKKYMPLLNSTEILKIKSAEEKYAFFNFLFYSISAFLILKRPIRIAKFLNFYIAGYLIFASKYYSIYLVSKDLFDIKQRIKMQKPFKMSENDVYDYTLIPDWRTYLYFYKIL